jgi:hypothetical protein
MPRRPSERLDGTILTYNEVCRRIGNSRSYLLLGNGFSIACDPVFRYGSLYEAAIQAGLSKRAQQLFERIGTNNFEGVMGLLENTHWVARAYGLVGSGSSDMLTDLEIIKKTLVEAIASSHLESPSEIDASRKSSAANFLRPYHIVFTTNYDLLLYWLVMHAGDPPPFEDCFRADQAEPDAPHLVFSQRLGDLRGILYLHGALHLYLSEGELRKHSWTRTGQRLTDLIRDGLSQGQYPLFVAEGNPEKKLQQIQGSGYLWYCLDKLKNIQSSLVIFGHSLGASDGHILDAIVWNRRLPAIYVGLHGNPDSTSNLAIRTSAQRIADRRTQLMKHATPLQVNFYKSDSVQIWDA